MIEHLQGPSFISAPSRSFPPASTPRRKRPPTHDASLGDALLQEPVNPVQREQALWRAVIMQMFTDALSKSNKDEAIQQRREALVWLRGNTRDFRTVCDYAGYDPEYVRSLATRILGTALR